MIKKVGLLFAVLVMLAGCAVPSARHVQAIDSSENTVKFLYTQMVEEESVRGVIECELQDSDLTNCRELRVDYR